MCVNLASPVLISLSWVDFSGIPCSSLLPVVFLSMVLGHQYCSSRASRILIKLIPKFNVQMAQVSVIFGMLLIQSRHQVSLLDILIGKTSSTRIAEVVTLTHTVGSSAGNLTLSHTSPKPSPLSSKSIGFKKTSLLHPPVRRHAVLFKW